jgi:hypothetical protein
MRTRFIIIIAASAAVAAPGSARADRRMYGETYNAATAEPGGIDLELWTTLEQPPRQGGVQSWVHQIELETGITDAWDVALYNVFQYQQGDTTRYQALKIESRYRLSQPGEWAVDPILYLEVRKEFVGDEPWALEQKLIVARDFRRLNLSANLVAEQELIPGGGTEIEWGYAAGSSWEVDPRIRLGVETWGGWRRPAGGTYGYTAYLGPALALAASRAWLVLGAGWGLNDASSAFRARAILAFQF